MDEELKERLMQLVEAWAAGEIDAANKGVIAELIETVARLLPEDFDRVFARGCERQRARVKASAPSDSGAR